MHQNEFASEALPEPVTERECSHKPPSHSHRAGHGNKRGREKKKGGKREGE